MEQKFSKELAELKEEIESLQKLLRIMETKLEKLDSSIQKPAKSKKETGTRAK